jgi:hypothetical protein
VERQHWKKAVRRVPERFMQEGIGVRRGWKTRMETFPLWFGRLTVTAFFAIAFLQSAVDKWLDSQGNLEFLSGHFARSPLRRMVPMLFWAITVLESLAGVLCGIGTIQVLFRFGTSLALAGLTCSLIALLCLFFGQRLAKEYGGAVVLANYVAVALLGLILLGVKMGS